MNSNTGGLAGIDNYDGDWGDLSADWPSVGIPRWLMQDCRGHYPEMYAAKRMMADFALVPYGHYVIAGGRLRLSNQTYADEVARHVQSLNLARGESHNIGNEEGTR